MKRNLAVFLALCVAVGAVKCPAGTDLVWATEVQEVGESNSSASENDFTYSDLGNGTIMIERYKGNAVELIIPSQLNGQTVVMIGGGAFYDCSNLTSITIPDSVTSIGGGAFYGCSSLINITIPDSVTSIEGSAFRDCSSLTTVVIPDSVTSIGGGAFYDCSNLTSITIPDSVTSIEACAFYGCSSLINITIPDSVTSIEGSAFRDCSSLINITIPDSVTSIGGSAFYDCSSLTNITIPDSVTSIGEHAFRGCSSLTNITIPDSMTSIELGVFYGCSSLTTVVIPDSVTSIGDFAFCICSGLTNITIPDSVTSIEFAAFSGCSSLTTVVIPDSVTSIGERAFSGCSSLIITISDSKMNMNIGDNAFYNCMGILLKISDGVTNIDSSAWSQRIKESLAGIIIPNDVKTINLSQCSNLTNITIPDSVTSIEFGAFSGCSSLTSITIPDSVIGIGERAFSGCSSLTSITIPESVTSIGSSAFTDCSSLTNITIPDSVTSIGDSAFRGCSGLTTVEMPKSVQNMWNGIRSIGISVFQNCSSLTSIEIPDGVTSIGAHAFRGCNNLTHVGIPTSVSSIGNYAFSDCGTELCIYCDEGSYAESYATDNGFNKKSRKVQTITASDFTKTAGDMPFPLNASSDGDGSLTYKSSDESVASITEQGIIEIKGAGTAQITITASETDLYKAAQKTITITVNDGSGSEFSPIIGTRYDIGDCTYVISSASPKEVSLISFNKDTLTEEENHDGEGYSLTIPNTVTINEMTFEVTAIASNACRNSTILTSINIGSKVNTIGRAAFGGCTNLVEIRVLDNNEAFSSYDGCLYNKDFSQLLCCPAGKATAKLKEGTASIKYDAFSGCEGLASIEIPESVTGIGPDEDGSGAEDNVFESCAGLTIHCAADSWICQYAAEYSIQTSAKKLQSVTASNFTKTVGDMPFFIQAKTDGDGVLTYKSSNDSVVSVSEEGIIIIKGAGTAQITITASETDAYTASETVITVTVNSKPGSGTNVPEPNPGNGQNTGNAGTPESNTAAESIQKTQSVKAKIKSAKNSKSKSMTLKLSGLSDCDGYQIQYGLKKNFKGAKSITKKTSSVTVKKLKAKKTYYVRARVYKKIAGTTYYGKWSSRKSVKIKK